MAGDLMPPFPPCGHPDGSLRDRVFARFQRAVARESRTARIVRVMAGWLCVTAASIAVGLLIPMRQPAGTTPDDRELGALVRMHDMRTRAFAGWMSALQQKRRSVAP